MLELETRTMGSTLRVPVEADPLGMLGQVPHWFEGWEQIFSRFRRDSELRRLNAARTAKVSDELYAVLRGAVELARDSGGLVTPTVLPALLAAGYGESFESITDGGALSPTSVPDASRIHLGPDNVVTLGEDTTLDLSGFVKGWAADRAACALGRHAPALVDVGGDVALCGAPEGGWRVGVDHPKGGSITQLTLSGGGVATSGRDYRVWRRGGVLAHHLIDPRTGLPAQTDVISATVIAASVWDAEYAAKRVLLSGSAAGLAWIEQHPRLAAIVVTETDVLYQKVAA